MRIRLSLSLVVLPVLAAVACTPLNTVPDPVAPTAAVQYYDLEVPDSLEIRSVDFSATTFTDVSGSAGTTTSSVGGRAFVRVHAVHRTTGEHFLLLYEDVTRRKRPVQVIRFLRAPDRVRPDSTR